MAAKSQATSTREISKEVITSVIDRFEYEHDILKYVEDYRAGRLETSSLAEVRERLGHS